MCGKVSRSTARKGVAVAMYVEGESFVSRREFPTLKLNIYVVNYE